MQPKAIAVFVTVHPNKRNGVTKKFSARVASCDTVDQARALIADDRRAMGDTFGGLIDAPGSAGREYHIFRAEWTEIKLAEAVAA